MARQVRVFEVGPRDGLQNEPSALSVEQRLEFIARLRAAGLRDIEIGSFVHPRWVPQMAATDELAARLPPGDGVRHWALVPNAQGLARARAAGVSHVALLVSASEGHARSNLNRSRAEALDAAVALAGEVAAAGLVWRGYVSVAWVCPYDGPVDPDTVLDATGRLLAAGALEVALGDTIGAAAPGAVRALARRAIEAFGAERLAFHFHDTRGMGAANAYAALEEGALTLDASAGGIGGCPYAPGAAGNLATEDLVFLLESLGVRTGVDLAGLVEATRWLEEQGITPASRYYRAARSAAAGT